MIVPDDARFSMHAIRDGLPEGAFINHIWLRRDLNYTGPTKSTGAWPHVRACDQSTEAKVNVARLPAKLKVQG